MTDILLSFRIAVNASMNVISNILKKHFVELNMMQDNVNKFELQNNYMIISSNDNFIV